MLDFRGTLIDPDDELCVAAGRLFEDGEERIYVKDDEDNMLDFILEQFDSPSEAIHFLGNNNS
ncbi:hypothetical protein LABALGNA3A7_09480 [Dellaglioa algida]|nr:hypothetical protein LABALGNA3A7_09480 [Dellaglioa algida]